MNFFFKKKLKYHQSITSFIKIKAKTKIEIESDFNI